MDGPDKDELKRSFQEQSAAHKKAREDFLSNAITTVTDWIRQLEDPELGPIGRKFLEQAEKSGCKQKIDIFFASCLAEYCSFSYDKGFVNQVTYGPAAEESLARLFSAMVHETTHALQKMQSAALHASPFNRDTKIVICPRDWMTLEERCEQDSYTKQALFNSLLSAFLPEINDTTKGDPLSPSDFASIRASAASMSDALVDAARRALEKGFYWDNPNDGYRFRNACQDQALKNYEAGMNMRKKAGDTGLIYVRLEAEDIAAIGASCGPNIFGQNGVLPEFLKTPEMMTATQDKLTALNKSCGIADESALPTLTEALAQIGLTREQFIARAYAKPAPGAGTTAPNSGPSI